ncbi:RloB family protein [Xanthobacter sp. 126]|uniref:RloB family protein n=1 Tax=Xanthobacter sp. 126 TaxID=1131814 RepID=UPI0009E0083A|nr:RloB family protein [Xanthobacter sp. 126]
MPGDRSLKRRAASRKPKIKFIIYSEGKNTEPGYFLALKKNFLGTLVDLEIIEAAGTPATIAEKARLRAKAFSRIKNRQSSFEENDEIWAVFDRDEHPFIDQALQICYESKVNVAFSDPCFELWLILHHRNFDRPDDRHQVQSELAKICTDYDSRRHKTTDCDKLMPYLIDAENRASTQLSRREEEGDPPRRPFTTVFKLTRNMRKAHDDYCKR